jgi:Right handed beta helix region
LIHSTNKTTLSGDLNGTDNQFIFTTNRTDNSNYPVVITGNNVVFDGFTVSGSSAGGAGIATDGTNATIKNSRVIDNADLGLLIFGGNATIANCSIMGNKSDGIHIGNSTASIKECLIANNGSGGVFITLTSGTNLINISNSTITSNANYGVAFNIIGATSISTLKNSLIYGNAVGGISTGGGGTINNTITYSLVQGVTTGTGNLDGNTVNPQFVSPLGNNVVNITGDYRLKDISPCINRGDNTGVSPLDLDRNVRPKDGGTDIGAYEVIVNPNEIISIITGNWESNDTWNLNRLPLATDKVIVNGHQVTVTTNTARAKNLEYKTGAILRYLSGGLLQFGL